MAIDRQCVWVYQRLTTKLEYAPGWNLMPAADKALFEAQTCGEDGFIDHRVLTRIKRISAKTPA